MSHDRYAKCVEDRHSRRAILSGIASTLGVSLMSPWSHVLEAAPASKATKAKKVIYFYMGGAMSHIDTFDPKPDRPDIQGDVGVVKTKTPGIVFLCGHGSDMDGSKALFLESWAKQQGRAFLRFDYSGHGQSDGAFLETNISDLTLGFKWMGHMESTGLPFMAHIFIQMLVARTPSCK